MPDTWESAGVGEWKPMSKAGYQKPNPLGQASQYAVKSAEEGSQSNKRRIWTPVEDSIWHAAHAKSSQTELFTQMHLVGL